MNLFWKSKTITSKKLIDYICCVYTEAVYVEFGIFKTFAIIIDFSFARFDIRGYLIGSFFFRNPEERKEQKTRRKVFGGSVGVRRIWRTYWIIIGQSCTYIYCTSQ